MYFPQSAPGGGRAVRAKMRSHGQPSASESLTPTHSAESTHGSGIGMGIDEALGLEANLNIPASDLVDIRTVEETPPAVAPTDARECPSCKSAISASAVICVQCGFNLKKGKATSTQLPAAAMANDETAALPVVTTAGPAPAGLFARLTRGWRKRA